MNKKNLAAAFALTLILGACTGSVTEPTDTGMDEISTGDEMMDGEGAMVESDSGEDMAGDEAASESSESSSSDEGTVMDETEPAAL